MKQKLLMLIFLLVIVVLLILFIQNGRKSNGKNNLNPNKLSENINQVKEENMDFTQINSNFNFNTKTVKLNNGYTMPILGLGTWTLTNEQAEECVYEAIKKGYRLIDTAQYYGDEVGVGKGLKKAISEGIVKREDVFVTSKIYDSTDHNAAIEKTLSNLDIEYVDLLLIHQPGFDDKGLYKAMENYYKKGKLKAIGISNYYTKEAVDEVLSYAEIVPSVIQNENHIYYQNTELKEYVKKYGIIIESWYPFGGRGHTSENFNNKIIKELAENIIKHQHRLF